ncbi:hypothetical protein [Streptomyces sioyaensis]|uniref:hypothetical protein n=1 Tax=Streptomyces sioyaensis TaxID=67364 RepID=UPI0037A4FD96
MWGQMWRACGGGFLRRPQGVVDELAGPVLLAAEDLRVELPQHCDAVPGSSSDFH